MSIEQALAANTAALVALTAALTAGGAVAAPAQAAAEQPADGAGETKSTRGTKGTPVATGPSKDGGKKTKPEPAGATPEELTAAIVAAANNPAVGRDAVVALLQAQFNVARGKEITDPAVRSQAISAIEELVKSADVG